MLGPQMSTDSAVEGGVMKKVPRQTFKTASRDSKKQRWEHAQKVWCFFGVSLSPPHEDLGTAIKNECNDRRTAPQPDACPRLLCLSKAGEHPREERESRDNGI